MAISLCVKMDCGRDTISRYLFTFPVALLVAVNMPVTSLPPVWCRKKYSIRWWCTMGINHTE
jgi:hypothetical protein